MMFSGNKEVSLPGFGIGMINDDFHIIGIWRPLLGLKDPAINPTITLTICRNKIDDSTLNVLQFNANGIGNILTEPQNKQHCTTHGKTPTGSGPYLISNTHIQHIYSQHLNTSTQATINDKSTRSNRMG